MAVPSQSDAVLEACTGRHAEGYHLWWVISHSADWKLLGVICHRCGKRAEFIDENLQRWKVATMARWEKRR